MKRVLLFTAVMLFAVTAHAVDFSLSWGIDDATGVTEYAIGSRVAGVEQPIQYTGSVATSAVATRVASPGQVVDFYVSPCNAGACGAWGPQSSITVAPDTPPAGTVTTTTATTTRLGPPALP